MRIGFNKKLFADFLTENNNALMSETKALANENKSAIEQLESDTLVNKSAIEQLEMNALMLNTTKYIQANDDLNDYKTVGSYRCVQASVSKTVKNNPYTTGGFMLNVSIPTGGSTSGYRRQELISAANLCRVFVRSWSGSAWTDWYEWSNKNDIATLQTSLKSVMSSVNNNTDRLEIVNNKLTNYGTQITDIFAEINELDDKFNGTTSNLNNVTTTGFYRYESSAENKPTSSGGGLLVLAYSSTYFGQLAIPNTKGEGFKYRYRDAGDFSEWKDL